MGDSWLPQKQQHLSALSEFLVYIAYFPGANNIAADALSGSLVFSVSLGLDFSELVLAQHSSADISATRTYITGMWLADVTLTPGGSSFLHPIHAVVPRV